jgi:hypothetical protein
VRVGELNSPKQVLPFASRLSFDDEDKLYDLIERYRNNPSLVPTRRNEPALKEAQGVLSRIAESARMFPGDALEIQTLIELSRERLAMGYLEWLDTADGQAAGAAAREDYAVNMAFNLTRQVLQEKSKLTPGIEQWLTDRDTFRAGLNLRPSWKEPAFMTSQEFSQLRAEFMGSQAQNPTPYTSFLPRMLERAGLEPTVENVLQLIEAQKPYHAPAWVMPALPNRPKSSTPEPEPQNPKQ